MPIERLLRLPLLILHARDDRIRRLPVRALLRGVVFAEGLDVRVNLRPHRFVQRLVLKGAPMRVALAVHGSRFRVLVESLLSRGACSVGSGNAVGMGGTGQGPGARVGVGATDLTWELRSGRGHELMSGWSIRGVFGHVTSRVHAGIRDDHRVEVYVGFYDEIKATKGV